MVSTFRGSKLFGLIPLFWIISSFTFNVSSEDSNETAQVHCYCIKNPSSKLYLDGSKFHIEATEKSSKDGQKWCLVETILGTFVILNKETGNATDVQRKVAKGNIISWERHEGDNQRWYINSDSTNANGKERNLVIELQKNNTCKLEKKAGNKNQLFELEKC